jgi:hypothetical protein
MVDTLNTGLLACMGTLGILMAFFGMVGLLIALAKALKEHKDV